VFDTTMLELHADTSLQIKSP